MEALAVIPSYLSRADDLAVLLEAIKTLRSTAPQVEVMVVDDGSPARHLVEMLGALSSELQFELTAKKTNEGFAKTVNVGLDRARQEGRDALLVNADVEFREAGWYERMQAVPAYVVGALLLYPNGLIQHAGVYFSLLTRTFGHIYRYGPADLPEAQHRRTCPVTAALQLVRHDALTEIGIYDEQFRMGLEDVDYCVRVFQAGGECVYEPTVRAVHHESLFRNRPSKKLEDWHDRSAVYFNRKHARDNFVEWVPAVI
jgi:GT2 family glycosyltransferase